MTKEIEALYIGIRESIFNDYERQEQFDKSVKFLDQFFSSNVVVPRGENRHPEADILHQAIEQRCLIDMQWKGSYLWQTSNWYPSEHAIFRLSNQPYSNRKERAYAVEWHAYADGETIQVRDAKEGGDWHDLANNDECEYRIKPSEPVYEWQYIILYGSNAENYLSSYYTDDEYAKTFRSYKWVKIEETKRARQ